MADAATKVKAVSKLGAKWSGMSKGKKIAVIAIPATAAIGLGVVGFFIRKRKAK